MGDAEKTQAEFDKAAHVVKLEVGDNRVIVNSIEPRGCYAEFDGERLHVAMNAQGGLGPLEPPKPDVEHAQG